MIARLIRASIANRGLVLLAAVLLAMWGIWSVLRTPLDALPDLSDTQVIIRTEWSGQTPRIIEDQVTYPLTTTMLSVPGVRAVRGYSFFGDSFVYILFDDNTDLYWARSRVLEYLSQVRDRLPQGVNPALGPDATGLGWIYEYALVDRTGGHDLGQLRALQVLVPVVTSSRPCRTWPRSRVSAAWCVRGRSCPIRRRWRRVELPWRKSSMQCKPRTAPLVAR